MTFHEFVRKYNGKYVNPDRAVPNQCVDLCNQYFKEVTGTPMIAGNAIDWDRNFPTKYYVYYRNTASFVPRNGDIAVFGRLVGIYGHVDIVYDDPTHRANRWNFWSFSQNWPKGTPAHIIKHPGYYGVKGFLRKR
jgi:hypothetical protein